jgi:hypothetical protein
VLNAPLCGAFLWREKKFVDPLSGPFSQLNSRASFLLRQFNNLAL